MDTLERAVLAYFGSPQTAEALLYALGGVLAVGLDGGSRRFNRLQFIAAAVAIILVSAGTGLVVRGAIPTMVGSPNGWVLMLADIGRVGALGYAMGLVAMARSRDSNGKNQRGHAIAAVVLGAVIPLAYVLLLGKTKTGPPGLVAVQGVPASNL